VRYLVYLSSETRMDRFNTQYLKFLSVPNRFAFSLVPFELDGQLRN
jgi:hypothetical protein